MGGDVSWLKVNSGYNGFPNDPGVPAAIIGGIDYAFANGWLLGGAISFGSTTQSFDLGGSFKQNEIAASLYAAYGAGPVWAKLVGTYGGLRYDVNRIVPIGITTRSNTGKTSGANTSLGAEFGYDFVTPIGKFAAIPNMPVKAAPTTAGLQITHGPLVGMVLQHISVNGFTETDPFAAIGGFTALAFSGQTRNSAVSEIGYRASIDIGIWRPFARLVWNHEFASTDRSVTATLTTVSAPSYWMPAVVLGKDWGTGTVGTTATIAQGVTG